MGSNTIEPESAMEAILKLTPPGSPIMIPFPPFDQGVTDSMVSAALEELKNWVGHPLLILPRLLAGNDEWDRHVLKLVIEVALNAKEK